MDYIGEMNYFPTKATSDLVIAQSLGESETYRHSEVHQGFWSSLSSLTAERPSRICQEGLSEVRPL